MRFVLLDARDGRKLGDYSSQVEAAKLATHLNEYVARNTLTAWAGFKPTKVVGPFYVRPMPIGRDIAR